jgi:hypothetical protein
MTPPERPGGAAFGRDFVESRGNAMKMKNG